jgi:hypothetical protein
MRPSLKRLCHYRPRFLTLIVFAAVAAMLVLANMSDDVHMRRLPAPPAKDADDSRARLRFDAREASVNDWVGGSPYNVSYGWPLRWRQYVVGIGFRRAMYGELHSAGRLAANAGMWLVIVIAPVATCEWLARRYRPRLRWSLRTMLAAVGIVAACCGWFVSVRNRLKIEGPLIADIGGWIGDVWVERWGPDWLELVGADSLRRRVIGADLREGYDQEVEELLERLAGLPDLQYLLVNVDQWTPGMTAALARMRRLRTLSVEVGGADTPQILRDALTDILADKPDLRTLSIRLGSWNVSAPEQTSPVFLTAICNVTQLESLRLESAAIPINSLPLLAGLANLKAITFENVAIDFDDPAGAPSLLAYLPVLSRLEALRVLQSGIGDGDLHHLQNLPNLKLLHLTRTGATRSGSATLASLESLEELAIDGDMVSAEALSNLQKLNRLHSLRIEGFSGRSRPGDALDPDQLAHMAYMPKDERLGSFDALTALRRSKPDLVIEGYSAFDDWVDRVVVPLRYKELNYGPVQRARSLVRHWKETQANKQTAGGPN